MRAPFGSRAYPMGDFFQTDDGVSGGDCGCKFSSYPQFYAVWDSLYRTLAKNSIAFAEFEEDDPDLPRFFLRKVTTYRCWSTTYDAAGPTLLLYKKTETWNFETEEFDVEYDGDADALDCTVAADPFVTTTMTTTPTSRRTVSERREASGTTGPVMARHTVLEVLSDEFTTRWLLDHILDGMVWDEEAMPPVGWAPFFTSDMKEICYSNARPGTLGQLFSAPPDSVIVPGVWDLSEDERVFTVQKVRYRVVLPHYFGGITFRVKWDEHWYSDPDATDEVLEARDRASGGGETETEIFEMAVKEENGVTWAMNFRLAEI